MTKGKVVAFSQSGEVEAVALFAERRLASKHVAALHSRKQRNKRKIYAELNAFSVLLPHLEFLRERCLRGMENLSMNFNGSYRETLSM